MHQRIRHEPFYQKRRLRVFQAAGAVLAVLGLISQPVFDDSFAIHDFVEVCGITFALICIFGRLWSILFVGGRKNADLVTSGPYSMTRNPLYFCSTIGAIGIGLMFVSATAAVGLGAVTFLVLSVTAAKEAEYLATKFGDAYRDYAQQTPFFWPKPTLYRPGADFTVNAHALKRTFVDCLYFLAVFPMIETLEFLHEHGTLPTLLRLY